MRDLRKFSAVLGTRSEYKVNITLPACLPPMEISKKTIGRSEDDMVTVVEIVRKGWILEQTMTFQGSSFT